MFTFGLVVYRPFPFLVQGNEYFKKCAYELAVESYAKAMELDLTNAVLPANRAMALLKLERCVCVCVCVCMYEAIGKARR